MCLPRNFKVRSLIDSHHIKILRDRGFSEFANIIESCGNCTAIQHSQSIWQPNTVNSPVEDEFLDAVSIELAKIAGDSCKDHVSSLLRTRRIQTSTHLTASEGPSFSAFHRLALLGKPARESYLVGAYSAVPFSNSAWPGCLNFHPRIGLSELVSPSFVNFQSIKRSHRDRLRDSPSEARIWLIGQENKNALVSGSAIDKTTVKIWNSVNPSIFQLVEQPRLGDSFCDWACKLCLKQIQQVSEDKNIVYFDLNEAVRSYLLKVLRLKQHPIYEFHFNGATRRKAGVLFAGNSWYAANSKTNRMEVLNLKNDKLVGKTTTIDLLNPSVLIDALEDGSVFPALVPVFTSLIAQYGISCFGSYSSYNRKLCSLRN